MNDALLAKLLSDVSEKLGALQRDVKVLAEQGEMRDAQHTFLLEQQRTILDELAHRAREIVDLREQLAKVTSEPPLPIPRDRAPSFTTEQRQAHTDSIRAAAAAIDKGAEAIAKSTSQASKWQPWMVAGAIAASAFFSNLANSCTALHH